jgi:small ligand-binding sensory domain FIST
MKDLATGAPPVLASGLSGNLDAVLAAEQACERVQEGLGGAVPDLTMLFISSHHVGQADEVSKVVRSMVPSRCLVGVSAEAVLGGRTELEGAAGVSVLAAHLPGAGVHAFTIDPSWAPEDTPEGLSRLGALMGASQDLRATLFFADPFSVPLLGLLPAMNRARAEGRTGAILGGIASAATKAGGNALFVNDRVVSAGLVGVSLSGPVRVDTVVSQGCRGFGPNLLITKARKNMILELGGKPALAAVQEVVSQLGEEDQALLRRGLFVGRVINEYKDRFFRDDYLIRNVLGADENSQGIAVNEFVRVGQTIRLHLRDAATADNDLQLLLDAQALYERPAGALLVTCNGRGTRLFDQPHHDADAITRAFAPPRAGEDVAKGGRPIGPETPDLPLAGFFAGGEIGPVGGESFIHGHSACIALFRPEARTDNP